MNLELKANILKSTLEKIKKAKKAIISAPPCCLKKSGLMEKRVKRLTATKTSAGAKSRKSICLKNPLKPVFFLSINAL